MSIMDVRAIWIKKEWKECGACIRCMDWKHLQMLRQNMIEKLYKDKQRVQN